MIIQHKRLMAAILFMLPLAGCGDAEETQLQATEPGRDAQQSSKEPARSEPLSAQRCDWLAASPDDPERTGRGVAFEELQAGAAVTTCRDAIAASPDVARFQYQYGRALHKAGNYDEALEWYRKAAEQEYIAAFNNIGFMYASGEGVARDDAEAAKWYRRGAEQDDPSAQNNLGFMYASGRGVVKDSAEAVNWYRKAAEQGHALAQYNVGIMYANGEGLTKDAPEAAKWYQLAAEQGYANAQYNLGIMYRNGEGVTKDIAKAVNWFRLAAEQRHPGAQYQMGVRYTEINQDTHALHWLRKAAEQGHAQAQPLIDELTGQEKERAKLDAELAEVDRAIREKEEELRLAQQYARGAEANEKGDYPTAMKEWLPIAQEGYPPAQNAVGARYANGEGVAKDDAEAVKWYRLAAEQGDADAQFNLGVMYDKGPGVAKDYTEAMKWYGLAAGQDHENAKRNLEILIRRQFFPSQTNLQAAKAEDKRGVVIGNDGALNTLEIYYSVACHHCLKEFDTHLKELESYVDDGLLRVVLIDVSSVLGGTDKQRKASAKAASALRCLSDQSKRDFDALRSFMSLLKKNVKGNWTTWVTAESDDFTSDSGIVSPEDMGQYLLARHGIDPSKCNHSTFIIQQVRGKAAFTATGAKQVPYYVFNGTGLGDTISGDGDANKSLAALLGQQDASSHTTHPDDIETLRKAAEAGDVAAQFSLGVKYAKGEGVPKSDTEAIKWTRKAAEQGDKDAKKNLEILLRRQNR